MTLGEKYQNRLALDIEGLNGEFSLAFESKYHSTIDLLFYQLGFSGCVYRKINNTCWVDESKPVKQEVSCTVILPLTKRVYSGLDSHFLLWPLVCSGIQQIILFDPRVSKLCNYSVIQRNSQNLQISLKSNFFACKGE